MSCLCVLEAVLQKSHESMEVDEVDLPHPKNHPWDERYIYLYMNC